MAQGRRFSLQIVVAQCILAAGTAVAACRTAPVRITNAPGASTTRWSANPLIWNGREYGLVWNDERAGAPGDVYFTTLDRTGALLSPETRITTGGSHRSIGFAWSGRRYGLIWFDHRIPPEVYYAVLDESGTSIVPETSTAMLWNSGGDNYLRLVWAGDRFVATWDTLDSFTGPRPIRFFAFDENGRILTPRPGSLFPRQGKARRSRTVWRRLDLRSACFGR